MTNPKQFRFLDADSSLVGASLMPMLPLRLRNGIHTAEVFGLVDSGSAVNVLPYSIGEQLGLVWAEQRREIILSGNLSRIAARGIVVTATVEGIAPARLAFAWAQTDSVRPILGQANFFGSMDICVGLTCAFSGQYQCLRSLRSGNKLILSNMFFFTY